MASIPEYLGTKKIYSYADNFRRTWFIWASYEPDGELIAIWFNNTGSFVNSNGPFIKSECDTMLKQQIWEFAEEPLVNNLIHDDDEVIEPSSKIIPFRR